MLDGHKTMIRNHLSKLVIGLIIAVGPVSLAQAEDGYDLWLRYQPLALHTSCSNRVSNSLVVRGHRLNHSSITNPFNSPMHRVIKKNIRFKK